MSLNGRREAAKRLMERKGRIVLTEGATAELAERLEVIYPTRPVPGPGRRLPRHLRRSIMAGNGTLPRKKRMANRGPFPLVYPTWQKGVPTKGVPVIDKRLYQSPELKTAIAERDATNSEGHVAPAPAKESPIVVPRFGGGVLQALQRGLKMRGQR